MKMCCCRAEKALKWSALFLVFTALLYSGLSIWLREKSYVFSADELKTITEKALNQTKSEGKDYNATFTLVEEELRRRYPNHILSPLYTEWIFVNAGGWMGAMYLLHASLTEYVLFFGAAVDTSGHSGRYWANISDTIISGKYIYWPEGTTETITYVTGETIYHPSGETAAMRWVAPFWAVEYGRGFIPSTLGFALSDTIFGTQDFVIMYKTFRIYTIALAQEIWYGHMII